MYASETSLCEVNYLRDQKGDVDSSQLPPRQDTLMFHANRVNYQSCILKMCLEQETDTPSPEGYGWMMEDGQIVIGWMQGLPNVNAVKCAKSLNVIVLLMH